MKMQDVEKNMEIHKQQKKTRTHGILSTLNDKIRDNGSKQKRKTKTREWDT